MQKTNALPGTMVIHIKKKYGYDSKDITEKVNIAARNEAHVIVADLELAEEDEEKKEEDNPEEEESDWKKKERIEKEKCRELVAKYNLKRDQVPYVSVIRNGHQVASFKVEEEMEPSEVMTWLETQSISLVDENEPDLPSWVADGVVAFAKAAATGASSEFSGIIEKIEKGLEEDKETAGEAYNEIGAIYLKTLKTATKKGDVSTYTETETKRLAGVISSSAITAAKKKEMRGKMQCLRQLGKKIAAAKKEEL